jgi:hypothetical protein
MATEREAETHNNQLKSRQNEKDILFEIAKNSSPVI